MRSKDAISVTNSNSLVHKIELVKRFIFHHTKAHSQSAIRLLMSFLLHKKSFLKSKMHAMEEVMLSV